MGGGTTYIYYVANVFQKLYQNLAQSGLYWASVPCGHALKFATAKENQRTYNWEYVISSHTVITNNRVCDITFERSVKDVWMVSSRVWYMTTSYVHDELVMLMKERAGNNS